MGAPAGLGGGPVTRDAVPGDPGSLARLASALQTASRVLRAAAPPEQSAEQAAPSLAPAATRSAAKDLRRRATLLDETLARLLDEIDHVSALVHDHAVALAEARGALHAIREAGQRAGLNLSEGRWRPAYGITGSVDRNSRAAREGTGADREELRQRLDGLTRIAHRRREALTASVTESTARLAAQAALLRRG